MKITLSLFSFVALQAYGENGYPQNAKISIPHSSLKASELLSKIEPQTECPPVYNKENIDTRHTVNVQADDRAVPEALDGIFKGTDIKYVMEGYDIAPIKNSDNVSAAQQDRATVRGVAIDQNGNSIIGVNVSEEGTTNGCIIDMEGNFSLNVLGDSTLTITYVGYQPQNI